MSDLLVSTVPGFEDVVEDELRRDFGLRPSFLAPGRVAVGMDGEESDRAETVRRLNRWARCVDRVGILLLDQRSATDLDAIETLAGAVPFTELFAPDRTFAVRATRSGTQDFRSPDIARVVGSAVNRVIRERTGVRGRVDLESPDVLVRADLQERRLILWLDTTGYDGLHVRSYRRYAHMASMRPTVANLMLRLSGWGAGALVDPFCGSATIPIEAALRASGSSPAVSRGRGWAWQRIAWLADGDRGASRPPSGLTDDGPRRAILGVERFAGHLQGGWENAALAGVTEKLRLHEGLAEDTDRIAERLGLDLRDGTVVTNPPFGRRVGTVGILADLYRESARAWYRAGIGTVVTLAERAAPMRDGLLAAGYEIVREVPVIYGSTPVTVFRAVRG